MNKKSLKILRYIYHKKSVTSKQLHDRFPKQSEIDLFKELSPQFFSITNYEEWKKNDITHMKIGENTLYRLNSEGESIVESKQWFNWQFILLHIALPVFIAIITTLITIFLTVYLSPSL